MSSVSHCFIERETSSGGKNRKGMVTISTGWPRASMAARSPSACASAPPSRKGTRSVAMTTLKSFPPVHVLEADDVVLAQVIAALHLDHHEVQHARVLEAVAVARRDVGRFVLAHEEALLA